MHSFKNGTGGQLCFYKGAFAGLLIHHLQLKVWMPFFRQKWMVPDLRMGIYILAVLGGFVLHILNIQHFTFDLEQCFLSHEKII